MWRISATFFVIAIILLSDVIAQSILNIFLGGDASSLYIMSLFLSKIIMLMLVYAAERICSSYGEGVLSWGYWAFLILCPFLSLISIYGLSCYLKLREMNEIYLSFSIGLVFINYFVFMICDHVLYNQSIEKQTRLLQQQISYYENQYQLAETAQKDTLRFRHDFKNILIGVQAELEAGKVAKGQDTIKMLLDNFNFSKGIVNSGNLSLDSILNYKQQRAAQENIPFYFDLRLPADIILDSTVISVIMGNILDNAIEACKRLKDRTPYVKIQIHYQNESLFIHIENPYSGSIRTDFTGRIHSVKTDHKKHGIGLESVQDMVEKNYGLMNISYKEGIFLTEIALFKIQKQNILTKENENAK